MTYAKTTPNALVIWDLITGEIYFKMNPKWFWPSHPIKIPGAMVTWESSLEATTQSVRVKPLDRFQMNSVGSVNRMKGIDHIWWVRRSTKRPRWWRRVSLHGRWLHCGANPTTGCLQGTRSYWPACEQHLWRQTLLILFLLWLVGYFDSVKLSEQLQVQSNPWWQPSARRQLLNQM